LRLAAGGAHAQGGLPPAAVTRIRISEPVTARERLITVISRALARTMSTSRSTCTSTYPSVW